MKVHVHIHVHVHVHVDYACAYTCTHVHVHVYMSITIHTVHVNVLFSFYSLDVIKPPEDTGLIPSASTTCPPGLHNRRFRE